MNKKVVSSPKAPAAIGPYSQGIIANGMVFTSGQLPINPASGEISGLIKDQARQAIENVAAVLEAAGGGLSSVVKVTVFLADIKDFAAVNEVYKEMFDTGEPFPARSAVQVAALPKPGALLEIEAIALLQ